MSKTSTSEKRESFRMGMRWPFGQRIFFLRHCVYKVLMGEVK